MPEPFPREMTPVLVSVLLPKERPVPMVALVTALVPAPVRMPPSVVEAVPPPSTVSVPDCEGVKLICVPDTMMVRAEVIPFVVEVVVPSVTLGPVVVAPAAPISVIAAESDVEAVSQVGTWLASSSICPFVPALVVAMLPDPLPRRRVLAVKKPHPVPPCWTLKIEKAEAIPNVPRKMPEATKREYKNRFIS